MIIGPIKKTRQKNTITLEACIEYGNQTHPLWYSFDESLAEYITDEVHDGFLVGTLLLAMKLGEDIYVKGKVSEKLYYNLTNYYMDIIISVIPDFKKIKIIAENFTDGNDFKSKGKVITGFSAGIDSFCTIYDHSREDTPEGYKITHLLFNNVGSHGAFDSERAEELFKLRYSLIEGFSKDSNLDFIKINSNISELLKMKFNQTHVPRNISAVLMLQKLVGKYYYASGYRYQDTYVGKAENMAYSDPFSIHLLSTEHLDCISSGCQHSRVEKTRRVSHIPSSKKWLNVCVSPSHEGGNCSACLKCGRTLLTLEILGEIDSYKNVFDLEKWNWAKNWYVPQVVLNRKNKDPLVEEIRRLASEKSFKFSLRQQIFGVFFSMTPNSLHRLFKPFYHEF